MTQTDAARARQAFMDEALKLAMSVDVGVDGGFLALDRITAERLTKFREAYDAWMLGGPNPISPRLAFRREPEIIPPRYLTRIELDAEAAKRGAAS